MTKSAYDPELWEHFQAQQKRLKELEKENVALVRTFEQIYSAFSTVRGSAKFKQDVMQVLNVMRDYIVGTQPAESQPAAPIVEEHGFKPGIVAYLDVESLEIAPWSPDDKAELPPTQVHLIQHIRGIKEPIILRFKGPDTLGVLIEQLARYRGEVWPSFNPL